eukprot:CAMPEP_0198489614 /NCGR_PEP_ID=MMETSP1462-20131121/1610_1 /TAXON_ID=1333877 /ORGANISM="Brandtodinium nutriculum, Strain RCC3387" /LENGTH=74 /DNA_ID=CAMNT_0044218125 /DNA_START=50 /DNA_END=271 /DNA_ORIENTATION=-
MASRMLAVLAAMGVAKGDLRGTVARPLSSGCFGYNGAICEWVEGSDQCYASQQQCEQVNHCSTGCFSYNGAICE